MAVRSSVFEGVQIGLEATSGGSVAANKQLGALSISPGIKADIAAFRPMGGKYNTLTALGKEWIEASLEGQLTYSELIYPLASLVGGGSSGGSMTGGSMWNWNFTSAQNTGDTVNTFTVEQGSATRAAKFSYGLITGLSMNFTRNETTLSGSMIGQALVDGITMTSNPTSIELVPILASQVSVYLDDTGAGVGGTQLTTNPLSVSWELTDRFNPVWLLDASKTSFGSHVEIPPKLTVKLKLIADATAMALLTSMRAGTTKFMRINCVGATVGAHTYLLNIDTAMKVMDVSEFSDEDGAFAIEWTFEGTYDSTWGKAFNIAVQNKQATL
jgi:hypothetical protein